MERVDIRDMNTVKAQNKALEIFEKLRPHEALVVVSEEEPKLIYDMIKEREDFDRGSYEVEKKDKNKYVSEFLKKWE